MKMNKSSLVLLAVLPLIGCGGGSGDSNSDNSVTTPPVVDQDPNAGLDPDKTPDMGVCSPNSSLDGELPDIGVMPEYNVVVEISKILNVDINIVEYVCERAECNVKWGDVLVKGGSTLTNVNKGTIEHEKFVEFTRVSGGIADKTGGGASIGYWLPSENMQVNVAATESEVTYSKTKHGVLVDATHTIDFEKFNQNLQLGKTMSFNSSGWVQYRYTHRPVYSRRSVNWDFSNTYYKNLAEMLNSAHLQGLNIK
ncbi:hypothetical protein CTM88_20675 [Photobacterium aquimaris]|uniref:Uncharacterized protein n=1 Tax=Photobacterium aquimaris TaxID=512643 RepID=A0A2T3IEE5_9GAMM|nr:hypothetical protein [Photobacterium aquimaris]OBU19979.1 hypothetical protein AYY20_16740 [Photobacterium aquimaris]PSU21751.1 hypothetical protein CTM88_20675 [Photobacterium aquimaris]